MLILSRRLGETVVLQLPTGEQIDVVLLEVKGSRGRLGIDAPPEVQIIREDLPFMITASADTGTASLPVTLSLCESIPATGECLALPASSVTTPINAGATPTFSIFVTGTGTVPFDPANNRIFVRFKDSGGMTRGSTSVAVRTQ